jgi:hypothetical protein
MTQTEQDAVADAFVAAAHGDTRTDPRNRTTELLDALVALRAAVDRRAKVRRWAWAFLYMFAAGLLLPDVPWWQELPAVLLIGASARELSQ